jgi:hypothetical protein
MELNTTHKTLNWLLERYLQNPNELCDISESLDADETLTVSYVHELGNYLVKKGFVKNHTATRKGFTCSITTLGINQVSNVFIQIKYKILEASIEQRKKSLVEILGIDPTHYRKVHDFATYLKRLGFIECIFHTDDVFAEATFAGREWYHENKLKFADIAA